MNDVPTYLWLVWLIKWSNHVIHLITFVIWLTALSKTTIKQMNSCYAVLKIKFCCHVKFYSKQRTYFVCKKCVYNNINGSSRSKTDANGRQTEAWLKGHFLLGDQETLTSLSLGATETFTEQQRVPIMGD